MTKQEVTEIIKKKAADFYFKLREMPNGWMSEQTDASYIRIEIWQEIDYEKTCWEERKVAMNIKATGCICQMGKRETPEELMNAIEEIAWAQDSPRQLTRCTFPTPKPSKQKQCRGTAQKGGA